MIQLQSNRLRVNISDNEEVPNNGYRFDRAGFVTDIVLDGDMTFTASEPRNLIHPSSGGRGLCCEYQADYSKKIRPGETYPKFGIGLIPKESEEGYIFYQRYPGTKIFPMDVKVFEQNNIKSKAVFTTRGNLCMGYAMTQEKIISVVDNQLIMEVKVTNTGEKVIETKEYCHNFISIDGMALHPDYHLCFPTLKDLGNHPMTDVHGRICSLRSEENGFTFEKENYDVSHVEVNLDSMDISKKFSWVLRHDGAKAYVMEEDSFIPVEVVVWAVDHIVSTEVIQKIHISPGEQYSWKRIYTFDKV